MARDTVSIYSVTAATDKTPAYIYASSVTYNFNWGLFLCHHKTDFNLATFCSFTKMTKQCPRAIHRTNLSVARGYPLVGSSVLFIWVRAVCAHAVDAARNDEWEELFARPQWPWLEHTRHGQTAIPRGQVHQQLHHVRLRRQQWHCDDTDTTVILWQHCDNTDMVMLLTS